MPFSTKDNHHATTSRKLWRPQLETLGERLPQIHLRCSYDLTRQLKEKHNHFLRHISLTYLQVITLQSEKHKNSQERNLVKLLQENEKLIIRNNEDLLSGSQRNYTSGQRFSLQTPYNTQL